MKKVAVLVDTKRKADIVFNYKNTKGLGKTADLSSCMLTNKSAVILTDSDYWASDIYDCGETWDVITFDAFCFLNGIEYVDKVIVKIGSSEAIVTNGKVEFGGWVLTADSIEAISTALKSL